MKKSSGIVVLVYAVLVLIGGMIGFIKASSLPSLIMGICFSAVLCASAIALLKNRSIGVWAASILTVILTVFFAFRFNKTHLFMPAGLMCILGVVVIGVLIYNEIRAQDK